MGLRIDGDSYDNWKLSTPPSYDIEECSNDCKDCLKSPTNGGICMDYKNGICEDYEEFSLYE